MTFGRRRPVTSASPGKEWDGAARLRADLVAGLRAGDDAPQAVGKVPTSSVAFIAASLAVMVAQLAALLLGGDRFAGQTEALLRSLGGVLGRDPRPLTTIALIASVWGGARAAALFTLPAHFILRWLDYRGIAAYAMGAAAVSIVWPVCLTAAERLLGNGSAGEVGSVQLLATESGVICLSAMVAGATYRLVAGASN
jgi:hypothetical protein